MNQNKRSASPECNSITTKDKSETSYRGYVVVLCGFVINFLTLGTSKYVLLINKVLEAEHLFLICNILLGYENVWIASLCVKFVCIKYK